MSQLGYSLGWSTTKVSRVESGHIGLPTTEVLHYLGPCEVLLPQALDLLDLCRTAERKLGYWLSPHGEWINNQLHSLIFHESTANESVTYESLLVPGLLQTPEYARVRISREKTLTQATVEQYVQVRLRRQEILHRPKPARFEFYIHEQALRLPVGDATVRHEQALHLALLSTLPHITIRVVPTQAGERSAFGGSFAVYGFDRHTPLVYLDNHITGMFLEKPGLVQPYQTLVPEIADVALDAKDSREFVATLADEYDLGSSQSNDQHVVAEEQL